MAPDLARVFSRAEHVRSLAVMCPAFQSRSRTTAGPDRYPRSRGSDQLASGSRCPHDGWSGFVSIRRVTDIAITRFHPRNASGLAACSARSGRHVAARPVGVLVCVITAQATRAVLFARATAATSFRGLPAEQRRPATGQFLALLSEQSSTACALRSPAGAAGNRPRAC